MQLLGAQSADLNASKEILCCVKDFLAMRGKLPRSLGVAISLTYASADRPLARCGNRSRGRQSPLQPPWSFDISGILAFYLGLLVWKVLDAEDRGEVLPSGLMEMNMDFCLSCWLVLSGISTLASALKVETIEADGFWYLEDFSLLHCSPIAVTVGCAVGLNSCEKFIFHFFCSKTLLKALSVTLHHAGCQASF